jgi:hypothetical protein
MGFFNKKKPEEIKKPEVTIKAPIIIGDEEPTEEVEEDVELFDDDKTEEDKEEEKENIKYEKQFKQPVAIDEEISEEDKEEMLDDASDVIDEEIEKLEKEVAKPVDSGIYLEEDIQLDLLEKKKAQLLQERDEKMKLAIEAKKKYDEQNALKIKPVEKRKVTREEFMQRMQEGRRKAAIARGEKVDELPAENVAATEEVIDNTPAIEYTTETLTIIFRDFAERLGRLESYIFRRDN